MAAYKFAMLGAAVGQDILDEVVTELIPSNCSLVNIPASSHITVSLTVNQRHARTIRARLTNTVEIAVQKLTATNLQTLLNHLGGVLVHAVLGAKAKDMLDGATAIRGGTMLANVLDAPVSKLSMCNHVDAGQDLVDTGTLSKVSMAAKLRT